MQHPAPDFSGTAGVPGAGGPSAAAPGAQLVLPAVLPPASPFAALPLRKRLLRITPYFSGQPGMWALAVVATLVGALTEPMIPALLQPLLDSGFTQGTLALWLVPVFIVGLFCVRGLAQFVYQYALSRITNDGMVRLRTELFARVQVADTRMFASQSASALTNTVVYEVQNGSAQLVQAFLVVARDGFTLVALLGYLLYLNWQLTLAVAFIMPTVAWVMKTLSRRLYRITTRTQSATDALAYVVEENVLAHRVVRLHGAQNAQVQRFVELSQRLRNLNIKSAMTSAAMTPTTQILAAVALSTVICIALWQGRGGGGGQVTVGSFVAFISAMLMLIAPMRRMADVVNPVTRGLTALERGLALLDSALPESGGLLRPDPVRGSIELHDVGLDFGDGKAPALHGVNLVVRPGEVVALVGPSGAGKTTLVNLLPRFLTPSRGEVRVDGVALSEWDLSWLRQQFSMVSQDVVMFNDTIAANVALGAQADEARVWHCLEAASLAAHVRQLPAGIHTQVGHNAAQLSGGQRQRLAIARALYKDAPILILDEATSALDAESERLVQHALQQLMRGRTTLVIAHRLSTIEHADRVIVMERGSIVEQGTHAGLLALDGLYARLHARGAAVSADAAQVSDPAHRPLA